MNGKATPDSNLKLDAAVQIIAFSLLKLAEANHWLVVPAEMYAATGAVGWLAAHIWDWKTGDNVEPPK